MVRIASIAFFASAVFGLVAAAPIQLDRRAFQLQE